MLYSTSTQRYIRRAPPSTRDNCPTTPPKVQPRPLLSILSGSEEGYDREEHSLAQGIPSIESSIERVTSSQRAQHEREGAKGVEESRQRGNLWDLVLALIYVCDTSVTCDAFVSIVGDGPDLRRDWVIVGCLPTTTYPPSTTSISRLRSVGDFLTARHVR